MPNTFAQAGEEVRDLAADLIERFHRDLWEVKVKVDYVFVFRDPDAEEPAIKVRGHRVLGQARINNLKHRVLGLGDCEVLLDGDAWDGMPAQRRSALVDHELEHFEVKRHPKTGEFLYDDYRRPQMKLRDHDWEMGFFDNIASRHGIHSGEVENLRSLLINAGGSYIPHLTAGSELGSGEGSEVESITITSGDHTAVFKSTGGLRDLAQKLKEL